MVRVIFKDQFYRMSLLVPAVYFCFVVILLHLLLAYCKFDDALKCDYLPVRSVLCLDRPN